MRSGSIWPTAVLAKSENALLSLSDAGFDCLAQLSTRCEELLAWPAARLQIGLVRLPKPTGGARLIGLLDTLLRLWGRARRPLSAARERSESEETQEHLSGRRSTALVCSLAMGPAWHGAIFKAACPPFETH